MISSIRNSLLFLLPLLGCYFIGGWYIRQEAIRDMRVERAKATKFYRETAIKLADDSALGTVVPRLAGLHKKGDVGQLAWGYYQATDEHVTVWVSTESRKQIRTMEISPIEQYAAPRYYLPITGGTLILITILWSVPWYMMKRERKLRDNFMASVSHDLRTPLSVLFLNAKDPEVRAQLSRLSGIVENLVEFLRMKGKRRAANLKELNLLECVFEAYHVFEADLPNLEFEFHDVQPVKADEVWLMQVLWNLYSNAVKYSAPHGPVKVVIDHTSVRFIDAGPGMSWWTRQRIFSRSYRASSARKSKAGGFGIGLATARELTRLMGGSLTVGNSVPHGTTFTLTLSPSTPLHG